MKALGIKFWSYNPNKKYDSKVIYELINIST